MALHTYLPLAILGLQHASEAIFERLNRSSPTFLAFCGASQMLTDDAHEGLSLLLGPLCMALLADVKVVLVDRAE